MTTDRWVLFDLDGTLFDYDAAEAAAVTATLRSVGIPPDAEVVATYRQINARHWAALERGETTTARLRHERWAEVLATCGVHDIDLAALAERYLVELAAGSQPVPGALEVVAAVAAHHPVAYLTNGLSDVQRPRLAASPLGAYTDVVVISDEVGVAKPDPGIFAAALARLGDPPADRVTMVGDSLIADIGGATALGMETVWVASDAAVVGMAAASGDPPRPTHRVRDIRELPNVLGLAADVDAREAP